MKFIEKIKNKKNIGYIVTLATLLIGIFLGNVTAPMCAYSIHDGVEERLESQEQVLIEKDKEIETLNAKIDSAKPWFEKSAEEQKAIEEESARKKAEQEEVERLAKEKEAEEQAKKDALGVDTDEVEQIANSIIMGELGDSITNTTLESVQVNENAGTDSNKDVIVLANLSWSTKNSEKMTREMLEMYSDHLATNLSSNLPEGSEIAIFWNAEYTELNIKHSYYIKNTNAYKQ